LSVYTLYFICNDYTFSHSNKRDDYGYSPSLLVDATIGFTQASFPVREDDRQVDVCVEISDLQAATEVSLTVSLDGASSGKAGRKICNGLCVVLTTSTVDNSAVKCVEVA